MILLNGWAVFYVDDAAPILAVIPTAKVANFKGRTAVAVPHDFLHMQAMRGFGLDAPAPVEQYKFPGKFKPYQHQIDTMRFLVENMRAYCLSGLGTGKTLSAAWAADYLMKQGIIRKCLIAAPLSCLERVWGDTLFCAFHHRKFVVLHGSRQQRLDALKSDWDFAVVNHHGLGIIGPELPEEVDLIILDELAVFRNHKAKTLWGATKKLITPSRWVWGITGSPTPNSPVDAFAQSKLVTPERYTGSFTRFKMDVMMQLSQFRWIPRANAEQSVNQILQPSIRYALEDCIDLPETIYQDREAELSPEQKHHYDKLKKECVTEIRGMEVTAVNAAVLMGKMLQASLGCVYSNGEVMELDFGPRLAVLEEVIEETEGKAIIFLPLTGALHALHTKLKKKYSCEVVEGSTSASKRNQIFSDFNEKDTPRLLIANPACMSHGLNLHHKCHTIIWATAVASHEIYYQANARTVRPGQKHSTNIIHIAASPVERKIYQTLKERGKFQSAVLELLKEK